MSSIEEYIVNRIKNLEKENEELKEHKKTLDVILGFLREDVRLRNDPLCIVFESIYQKYDKGKYDFYTALLGLKKEEEEEVKNEN